MYSFLSSPRPLFRRSLRATRKLTWNVRLNVELFENRLAPAAISWTGATSTDWFNALNWSGGVPTSSDDVTIPAGKTNYPVLNSATAANAKTITLATGSGALPTLTDSQNTLTVAGNIAINNGTFTVNGGTVTMTAGNPTIAGTLTVSGGTFSAGNGNLSGAGTLNLSGTGTLAVNDFADTGSNNITGGTLQVSHDFKPTAFSATGGVVEWTGNSGGGAFPLTNAAYSPAQTLNGAITAAQTTITASGTAIQNGDVILINNEQMLVTAGGGTTSLTVIRGLDGTAAATHNSATAITKVTSAYAFYSVQVDANFNPGFNNSNSPLFVAGNWTNNSTGTSLTKNSLIFNGSAAQTIGGSVNTTFLDLIINNAGTAGVTVSSTNTETATGTATVTKGTLLVDGTLDTTNPITISSLGTLGGSGTVNDVTDGGGTIDPGDIGGTGILTSENAMALTGTLTNNSTSVTGLSSTSGLYVGESVTGTGIAANTTISAITANNAITLSANATTSGSQTLTFLDKASLAYTGTLTNNSTSVTGLGFTGSGTLTNTSKTVTGLSTTTGLFVGELVTGTGIPNNTTITAINSSTQITLNNAANQTITSTLTFGNVTNGGQAAVNALFVGEAVIGTGIPAGTTISAINAPQNTITLSQSATTSGSQSLTFSPNTVTLNSSSTFAAELNGTTAGTGYDQLNVAGNVVLGSSTLNLTLGGSFAASHGNTFTVIQSTNPISGTFAGLAEGSTVVVRGQEFTISYKNDNVVLTYQGPSAVTFSVSTANNTPLSSTNTITVHYTSNGTGTTTTIWDGHSFTGQVDQGSTVTFDTASSGSTSTERWQTNGTTSFTVSGSSTSFSATYYDQLNDAFSASTASGGMAMTSSNYVTASWVQFGGAVNDASKIFDGTNLSNIWIDRASTATLSATSTGATSTERWQANSGGTPPSFTVTSSMTLSATYYDQLKLTVSGNPAAHDTPSSTGTAFGSSVSDGGTTPFYDRGSTATATLTSGFVVEGGILYQFTGWSSNASGTGLTSDNITMNAAKTATANWSTPVAGLSGPSDGVAYQPRTFTFTASGGASNDAAGYTYNINWGDGSPIDTVPATANNATITQTHVYTGTGSSTASSGTFTVSVTATDQFNNTSAVASQPITISFAAVEADSAGQGGITGLAVSGGPLVSLVAGLTHH